MAWEYMARHIYFSKLCLWDVVKVCHYNSDDMDKCALSHEVITPQIS